MPWCPNCKNEYVEGITKCADCGCDLVASLEKMKEAVIFGDMEQMNRLLSFMKHNGVTSASLQEDETEHVYEIFVSDKELQQAKRIANIFLIEEAKKQTDTADEETEEISGRDNGAEEDIQKEYVDSARMAAEFRESGYAMIGVGAVGLAAVVLMAAGVLPIRLSYVIYIVMGAVFLIFTVIGVRSIASSKTYKKKALTESNLKEEIMSWCRDHLTSEKVDELFDSETLAKQDFSEEEKYFKRTEYMKNLISQKFINIENGFLDNLIDEFYPEIFD